MFKLLFALPLLGMGLVLCMALLPLGIAALTITLTVGVLAFALRLTGVILAGVGTLLCGVFGLVVFAFMLAVGLAVLGAVFGALAHLLVPVLFVVGLVWLIRHLSRPAPPPLGHF